jgi:hypothetical protein
LALSERKPKIRKVAKKGFDEGVINERSKSTCSQFVLLITGFEPMTFGLCCAREGRVPSDLHDLLQEIPPFLVVSF